MAIQDGQNDRGNRGTFSSRWWRRAPSSLDSGVCIPAEVRGSDVAAKGGVLVPFPIHGEALLVKLADTLRNRIAGHCSAHDPLLLKMSRHPGSRLAIDKSAYVEFDADRATYHAVIEAASDTKVTLDTTDFDTLVSFVVQYVTERPAEPATLESVS